MNTTLYYQQKLGDLVFGNVAYSVPTFYLGLFTDVLSDDITNGITAPTSEVPDGITNGYQRVPVANDKVTFASADGSGNVETIIDILFANTVADWGNVSYIGVFDALTDGNLLIWDIADALEQDYVNVVNGTVVQIDLGSLIFKVG
jgi:hypothetical protein|tara:strand:- start:3328 stop:3765 length:438 start_codon:yes stop_codon:yes gene_type:complete